MGVYLVYRIIVVVYFTNIIKIEPYYMTTSVYDQLSHKSSSNDNKVETVYYSYGYDNKIFEIDADLIPENSLLAVIHRGSPTQTTYTSDPNFEYVVWYIQNRPVVNDEYTIKVLDYWGVYRSYDRIWEDEKYMRNNMYNPLFGRHPMNTDMYYRLNKMDRFKNEYMDFIELYKKTDDLLFYSSPAINVASYEEIGKKMNKIDFLFTLAEECNVIVLVAGEFVFDKLIVNNALQSDKATVDIFFVDSSLEDISIYIEMVNDEMKVLYAENSYAQEMNIIRTGWKYTRTKYSISIEPNIPSMPNINFILKLYRTYSEALHSFDVDCRCVGWDGSDIWATERGRYALYHGFNTVNVKLATPFYELMLVKYAIKGISINIPDIEKYQIKYKSPGLFDDLQDGKRIISLRLYDIAKYLQHLKVYYDMGIDTDFITRVYDLYRQTDLELNNPQYRDYGDHDINPLLLHGLNFLLFIHNKHGEHKGGLKSIFNLSDYQLEIYEIANRSLLERDILRLTYSFYLRTAYNRNDKTGILEKLNLVLQDQWIRGGKSLPETYDIITNDPESYDISVIQIKGQRHNLIDSLTVPQDVYEVMEIYGNIQLTRDVSFIVTNPNGKITSVFGESLYDNESDWYLGPFVSAK